MSRASGFLGAFAVALLLAIPLGDVIRPLALSAGSAAPYSSPAKSDEPMPAQSESVTAAQVTSTASPTATKVPTATGKVALREATTGTATAAATATAKATLTATATPVVLAASSSSTRLRQIRLPIFMYHYIRVNPVPTDRIGYGLSVPPDEFAAQLDFLAARGYQAIGLEEVAAYLRGAGAAPPSRSVVLTFDDGYADAFSAAFPLLKKHGFRATIFMITGLIDRPGYLSWAQLRELAANGVTIGSHTVSHPDLTKIGEYQLQRELVESKSILESGLARPVRFFCYPSGRYNAQVVSAVKETGYQAAVTVNHGVTHMAADLLTLKRVRVSGGQSVGSIAAVAGLLE